MRWYSIELQHSGRKLQLKQICIYVSTKQAGNIFASGTSLAGDRLINTDIVSLADSEQSWPDINKFMSAHRAI